MSSSRKRPGRRKRVEIMVVWLPLIIGLMLFALSISDKLHSPDLSGAVFILGMVFFAFGSQTLPQKTEQEK